MPTEYRLLTVDSAHLTLEWSLLKKAGFVANWKDKSRQLRIEVYALYLAYRDPRVPLHAKIFAALVVGYAFSPIDLIPDFIPIIGYLDDLILIPLGIALALKMIPPDVLDECRARSRELMAAGKPKNLTAAIVIVAIWILMAIIGVIVVKRILKAG